MGIFAIITFLFTKGIIEVNITAIVFLYAVGILFYFLFAIISYSIFEDDVIFIKENILKYIPLKNINKYYKSCKDKNLRFEFIEMIIIIFKVVLFILPLPFLIYLKITDAIFAIKRFINLINKFRDKQWQT